MFKKLEFAVYRLLKDGGQQSQLNDIVEYVIGAVIGLNVIQIIFESMKLEPRYARIVSISRMCFFVFFLVEYILRVWIADIVMRDRQHPILSRIRYMLTFRAIIDLLALIPVMVGHTFIDFRIFRILRLLRISRMGEINKYTIILIEVFKLKAAQLMSSIFIAFIFMLASAVIIYDLEHKAQPHVFVDILSGLWWAMSAITTIGYGDIYPVTPIGRLFASCMSLFGFFLMAVPIGILTTGFFEISKKYGFIGDKPVNSPPNNLSDEN